MNDASELAIRDGGYPLGRGKAVIVDRQLGRMQKISVGLTVVVPAAATVYALVLAAREGVSGLNITLFLIFYLATLIGITVGFHRLLTHRAFTARRWAKITLVICGSWAAQGPALQWVSTHRRHHVSSDRDGDPHSPNRSGVGVWGRLKGLLYAHIGSGFTDEVTNYSRFAPDLLRDPDMIWVSKHYLAVLAAGLVLPCAIGGLVTQSLEGAWTALIWGGFVRMFVVHHGIMSITSIAHVFGVKTFRSADESRNSYWLALLTGGEGWHNTHHAFPQAAIFSTSYWQIDIGGMVVWTLEKLGIARDVNRITPEGKKAKSLT
jgi:stearoyl-CoA desaturase (delta-9 desaturase)